MRSALPYAAVALAAAGWGTWKLFLHAAEGMSPSLSPQLEAAVMMAVVTLVSGVAVLRDRVPVRARLRDWLGIVWLGVGDAGNVLLLFAAFQRTSTAVAILTHYLTPAFVALLAPIALKEHATRASLAAVGVSMVGLLLLLRPWSAEAGPSDLVGALLGAGSAACYASNVIVNKRLAGVFSASELMFYHGVVATPLLALVVPHDAWAGADLGALGVVALGGVGPGAICGLLFVWALQRMPANHASTLTFIEPLVAVLLSVAVLGERVTLLSAGGGALILGGAAVVITQAQKGPRKETSAT